RIKSALVVPYQPGECPRPCSCRVGSGIEAAAIRRGAAVIEVEFASDAIGTYVFDVLQIGASPSGISTRIGDSRSIGIKSRAADEDIAPCRPAVLGIPRIDRLI